MHSDCLIVNDSYSDLDSALKSVSVYLILILT